MSTLKINFDYRVTKAFLRYRETGNAEEWTENGSSVFDVYAEEENGKIPQISYTLNGYEIINALGNFDIDFLTVEPAELWHQILTTTNLLDEKL